MLNECQDYKDLHIAPLVPRTGLLSVWELMPYRRGMLLRFPHTKKPYEMDPFIDIPVLYDIAEEYEQKAKVLNAGSIGALNKINQSGGIQDFILMAEALQNKKLAAIADMIAEKSDKTKVILIAGPSSSGKTLPTACAAPVVVGIIFTAAARARRGSLCEESTMFWSPV